MSPAPIYLVRFRDPDERARARETSPTVSVATFCGGRQTMKDNLTTAIKMDYANLGLPLTRKIDYESYALISSDFPMFTLPYAEDNDTIVRLVMERIEKFSL